MDFKISARHFEVTPAIREYAQKKTARLHRHYDRIQEIQAVIDRPDREFHVEIIVNVEHHEPFIARQHAEDLYGAIDLAVDKVERQLTDHKEKHRNRKHLV